jgi:hypothetical protein
VPVAKVDQSKPDNRLPRAFRPGGGVVEGRVVLLRDNVRWEVRGWDDEGRLWCSTEQGTAWLEPGRSTW